jgi:hypothetical protein
MAQRLERMDIERCHLILFLLPFDIPRLREAARAVCEAKTGKARVYCLSQWVARFSSRAHYNTCMNVLGVSMCKVLNR